ncbi:hypothetical protein CNMCM6936_003825 [Aspergillus lentulus]|uniref:Uncharacterized protein n=1 Tax=Aspergillus lentulus TaxID=293939 RepID=A0ABQ1ANL3_ASPLE|nr:hypothetical protein CNMCM6936_003825 [Aspergillus lentulus]GFF63434.1 hypothetical protein IFM62136_05638 [Aspergillus lentulus]GFF76152.1 hypothetical protein IFM47457_04076 [Aspergillus lentulus]GFF85214.1 hypothetical protein IFM60648_07293 [Aspergillus lentulus]GFG10936.1 hypothetical protein IFM61392_06653 [Aspergillus lentulus]
MASTQTPSPARAAILTSNTRSSQEVTPDFTDPSFDPADFLNDVLPPLTLASSQSRGAGAVPLAELSAQVQSILTQINAQNVRLSNQLTQLTDEILRSGGRLAYEVEVLRGEAIGLSDTLTEVLQPDIAQFVPEGLQTAVDSDKDVAMAQKGEEGETAVEEGQAVADPDYITKLRMLNQVRSRLEDVVQTFGDAMEWPLPPSETSLTSSFISVSAPEPGPESQSLEEKGQEVAKKLRNEITELLNTNGGGQAGLDAATKRLEALRELATIWKGSAEEKARNRFLDSLAKIIDDRRRSLENQGSSDQSQARSSSTRGKTMGHQRQESEGPGGGIFKNLQRLREEIYLE